MGLQDGSLYLWDLREPDSAHGAVNFGPTTYTVRHPTFSTACMAPDLTEAAAPIVAVALSSVHESKGAAAVGSTLTFGLVSLSEWGCLSVWSVLSASDTEAAGAGSAPDDGLRFGATPS